MSEETMSMVERVARAISEASNCPREPGQSVAGAWWWDTRYDHPGNTFAHECRADDLRHAHAAIEAMRDLNDEMAEIIAIEGRCCGGIAESIWSRCIDAALSEGEGGGV